MLATILTFVKLAKAGGSGCLFVGKALVEFAEKSWKREDDDAVDQRLMNDEEDPPQYLQQQLTKKKPSALRRLYNNRLSLKQILARLIVGYALAIREVGIVFWLIHEPTQVCLSGSPALERVNNVLKAMMVTLVPVEAFANLFADLHGSHLGLEFLEKWYAMAMIIWVVMPIWASAPIQLLSSFAIALIIAGLDMFEMIGTDLTQVKHHVLTGFLKKEERQYHSRILTQKEKMLRWIKGALFLPLRLLHLVVPALINTVVVFGLLSIMVPDKWANIKRFSNYPAYAFAVLGTVLRIAAMRLANYQHRRQLTRNPLYYVYLGYKALDSALYAAFQVFFFVIIQTTMVEDVLSGESVNTYYQADLYLMLNLIAHQCVVGGIAAYQAWNDISKMFTKKLSTYSVPKLTTDEISEDIAFHEKSFMQGANRPRSEERSAGLWQQAQQAWKDLKAHVSPDAELISMARKIK